VPRISLENTTVKSLPLPEIGTVDYWDEKLPAFGCRVSQGGAKTFILKLHNSRRAIGRYPIISLADARTEAKRLLAEKTLGKQRPQSMNWKQAVDNFIESRRDKCRAGTVDEYKRLLDVHFPFQGQLAAVSHDEFERKLKRIGKPSERNHALAVAKTFFGWAVQHRYIIDNPTVAFSLNRTLSRSRVLSDDELKHVWKAAGEIEGSFGKIVKLAILTGQRRGEIAALDHAWIGADTVALPASITKNKREHEFPIGASSRALLPSEGKGRVFPARGKPDQPFNGWSKGKAELDKKCGVADWTLHDIRRTVATNLAALGVQLPVIERLLNHVSGSFGGIVSVYQRHSFMPEMRAAVEKWETHLLELLAG
jgi:integrase